MAFHHTIVSDKANNQIAVAFRFRDQGGQRISVAACPIEEHYRSLFPNIDLDDCNAAQFCAFLSMISEIDVRGELLSNYLGG